MIVLSHGELAAGLLHSARMSGGDVGDAEALGFEPGEGPEDLRDAVEERLSASDEGSGSVLLLADIPGGVPGRVAAQFAAEGRCEAVAGVNLPMLLELIIPPAHIGGDRAGQFLAARRAG